MSFQIIKSNILSVRCDAIVNPTDEIFSGSGGLDAQIHAAAGPELRRDCDRIGSLAVGSAVITESHLGNCSHVIHTAAPWWENGEEEVAGLRRCYRSCLEIVSECGFEEVAFPLIGSGTRGFPKELVLQTASEEISEYLNGHDGVQIILVVHDKAEFQPNPALLARLDRYINHVQWQEEVCDSMPLASTAAFPAITDEDIEAERKKQAKYQQSFPESAVPDTAARKGKNSGLFRPRGQREEERPLPKSAKRRGVLPKIPFKYGSEAVLDESFSQMVLRKIDEKGFKKDSDCYNRANIDRRLFSRIRSDQNYHPKKTTALALAIALELSLDETKELLMKAGYSLSHSILFDVVIEGCILERRYNIFEVNEILFYYDQPLLGG